MIGAKHPFTDRQRLAEQRLGLGIALLVEQRVPEKPVDVGGAGRLRTKLGVGKSGRPASHRLAFDGLAGVEQSLDRRGSRLDIFNGPGDRRMSGQQSARQQQSADC